MWYRELRINPSSSHFLHSFSMPLALSSQMYFLRPASCLAPKKIVWDKAGVCQTWSACCLFLIKFCIEHSYIHLFCILSMAICVIQEQELNNYDLRHMAWKAWNIYCLDFCKKYLPALVYKEGILWWSSYSHSHRVYELIELVVITWSNWQTVNTNWMILRRIGTTEWLLITDKSHL